MAKVEVLASDVVRPGVQAVGYVTVEMPDVIELKDLTVDMVVDAVIGECGYCLKACCANHYSQTKDLATLLDKVKRLATTRKVSIVEEHD